MPNKNLQNLGFSSLMLGLAVGGLGHSLHVSETLKISLSILSILFSLTAMGLFIKAAPSSRRKMIVGGVTLCLLVMTALMVFFLRR